MCFFNIEDSEKLLFLHHLADLFHTLAHLNMIKNRQRLDENHCSHQQTPQLKSPCAVSALAHVTEICSKEIKQNLL